MPELQFTVESETSRVDLVSRWILRCAVAIVFLVLGAKKFDEASMWAKIFVQIGFGDWFRYLTGTMQIAGALLLVVPRTARLGAAVLACTMIGAILAHLFLLGTGVAGAIIPAIALVAIIVVGARR